MDQSTRACRSCGVVKPENGAGNRPALCRDCHNAHRRDKRAARSAPAVCVQCGKHFKRASSGDKLCSPECRYVWDCVRRGSSPLSVIECSHCGDSFRQPRANSRHCGEACRDAARYRERKGTVAFTQQRQASARRYYDANRDRILEAGQVWREANRDRHREVSRAWSERNRYRVSVSWRRRNPEKHASSQRARTALLRELTPVAISQDEVMAKMAFWGFACWMCGGDFEEVDHVKPISRGGLNILANLRPACFRCNNWKRAKWFGPSALDRLQRTQ